MDANTQDAPNPMQIRRPLRAIAGRTPNPSLRRGRLYASMPSVAGFS
jgi:hypothetical protein